MSCIRERRTSWSRASASFRNSPSASISSSTWATICPILRRCFAPAFLPRHPMLPSKSARRRRGNSSGPAATARFARPWNGCFASGATGTPSSRNSRVASPNRRAFRSRLLLIPLRSIAIVGRILPLWLARAIGVVLGHLAWHLAPRHRRVALENIALAFPEWTARRHRSTIRRMFHHLGQSLMEIVWLPNLNDVTRERTTVFEGHVDRFLELAKSGRGTVVFTGHCGNWEW